MEAGGASINLGGIAATVAAAPLNPVVPGDDPPLAPTLRRDPAMDFRLEEPALEECAPCVNEGPPPECPVCKHFHFQGTACETCGHVGKTNAPLRLFPPRCGPFPPILADPPRKPLALKLLDGASEDVDLKLCMLIRDQVFAQTGCGCSRIRRRVPGMEGDPSLAGGGAAAGGDFLVVSRPFFSAFSRPLVLTDCLWLHALR